MGMSMREGSIQESSDYECVGCLLRETLPLNLVQGDRRRGGGRVTTVLFKETLNPKPSPDEAQVQGV